MVELELDGGNLVDPSGWNLVAGGGCVELGGWNWVAGNGWVELGGWNWVCGAHVAPGIELVEIQSQPTAGIEFTLSGIGFYPDDLYCNIVSYTK